MNRIVRFKSILVVFVSALLVFLSLNDSLLAVSDQDYHVGELVVSGSEGYNGVSLSVNSDKIFALYNLAPGDVWSEDIRFENLSENDSMEVRLVEVRNNIRDDLLFEAIYADIVFNGDVIFSGFYADIYESLKGYVFEDGDILEITYTLPDDKGNELQGTYLDSTWFFSVVYEPVLPGIPIVPEEPEDPEDANVPINPDGPYDPSNPSAPDGYREPDDTGDKRHLGIYVSIFCIGLLLLIILVIKSKKEDEK